MRRAGSDVGRVDALGRSGIEWRELKVITLIFTGGTVGRADRKNATARECTQVRSNGDAEGVRRQQREVEGRVSRALTNGAANAD